MNKDDKVQELESTIKKMRRYIRPVLVENKELKAELKKKTGTINVWYALSMLGMILLLLTAVADDIRLRFVIAENTLLTEQLLEYQVELEGMVFGGADAMTSCADTLNMCSDRTSELGVALEKSLAREAKWKDVANECLEIRNE